MSCLVNSLNYDEPRIVKNKACIALVGTNPDEMGIGPVFAVPKLLEKNDLSVDDIDLWELNEAFAVQVLYCRDQLGIPDELLNVNSTATEVDEHA